MKNMTEYSDLRLKFGFLLLADGIEKLKKHA